MSLLKEVAANAAAAMRAEAARLGATIRLTGGYGILSQPAKDAVAEGAKKLERAILDLPLPTSLQNFVQEQRNEAEAKAYERVCRECPGLDVIGARTLEQWAEDARQPDGGGERK